LYTGVGSNNCSFSLPNGRNGVKTGLFFHDLVLSFQLSKLETLPCKVSFGIISEDNLWLVGSKYKDGLQFLVYSSFYLEVWHPYLIPLGSHCTNCNKSNPSSCRND
jgi:hypothetical protein